MKPSTPRDDLNHTLQQMVFPLLFRQFCHDKLVAMIRPVLARYPDKITYVIWGITIVIDSPNQSVGFSFEDHHCHPAFTVGLDSSGPVDLGAFAYMSHVGFLGTLKDALDTVYNAKELF